MLIVEKHFFLKYLDFCSYLTHLDKELGGKIFCKRT